MDIPRSRSFKRSRLLLMLIILALVLPAPLTTSAVTSCVGGAGGFGAAFCFSQTIGPISFTGVGTIGDAFATGDAFSALLAHASVATAGIASGRGFSLCAAGFELSGLELISISGAAAGSASCF